MMTDGGHKSFMIVVRSKIRKEEKKKSCIINQPIVSLPQKSVLIC